MPSTVDKRVVKTTSERSVKWYGWNPDLPDHRDHRLAAPSAPSAFPASAGLSPALLPPIRDQGAQGSCTGHAVRTLGQYLRSFEQQAALELSPRFIYYCARMIEHTTHEDAGAEIRDCIKQVNHLGFASEKDCPYNPAVWAKRPSNRAFIDARQDMATEYLRPEQTLLALKQVIADDLGFVFGFTVYENFEDAVVTETGLMSMPEGQVLGGHAVTAVGYSDSRQAFLIANSWGTDWGAVHPLTPPGSSRGYFWMPYDYLLNKDLCDDFWVVRKIS